MKAALSLVELCRRSGDKTLDKTREGPMGKEGVQACFTY